MYNGVIRKLIFSLFNFRSVARCFVDEAMLIKMGRVFVRGNKALGLIMLGKTLLPINAKK